MYMYTYIHETCWERENCGDRVRPTGFSGLDERRDEGTERGVLGL